jgi:precorrin-8X/cobalt-precorrin-8 methylmutase
MSRYDYLRDGAEIYRHSFATIRAEADLSRFTAEEEPVALRIIHACGDVKAAADLVFAKGAVAAARQALAGGAAIFCDSQMVAAGITRARLPAANDIICTLNDPRVPQLAADLNTTRSAAALELWRTRLFGSLDVIGNAPTALFHLLDMLSDSAPTPAAIIGVPVGFVGAAESKEALIADSPVPFFTVRGRRGGSAIAAATVNAVASPKL